MALRGVLGPVADVGPYRKIVPHGRFAVLDALTAGYLSRLLHADRQLETLRDHVERDETEVTSRTMCLYLPTVRRCSDRVAAWAFSQRLFGRYQAC